MYEDWVIVIFGGVKEYMLCKAPAWSGLKKGDLVKVEACRGYGTVEHCITVDTERDEKIIDFIAYLADEYPTNKILARLSEREMNYETVGD